MPRKRPPGTSPFQPNTAPQLLQTCPRSPLRAQRRLPTVLGLDQNLIQQLSLTSDLAKPITDVLSWCAPGGEFDHLNLIDVAPAAAIPASVLHRQCEWPGLHTVGLQPKPTTYRRRSHPDLCGPNLDSATSGIVNPNPDLALRRSGGQSIQTGATEPGPDHRYRRANIDHRRPGDGCTLFSGDSYMVGGAADDATSWVDKVEISTDGGGSWQTATGTDSWAWVWTLPADWHLRPLSSRATDIVGNVETNLASTSVTVDNTAPGACVHQPHRRGDPHRHHPRYPGRGGHHHHRQRHRPALRRGASGGGDGGAIEHRRRGVADSVALGPLSAPPSRSVGRTPGR